MSELTKFLTEIFTYIDKLSKGNQLIAGAISLWGLSVVTYLCRNLPLKIYEFLLKHCTTKLTITSQHEVFHLLLKWFEEKGYSKKFRILKLSNGRWGYDKETIKTVGYGSHIFWYNWHPIKIVLNKEQTMTSDDKEEITLIKLGRSHKIFDAIIKELKEKNKEDENKLKVYKYDNKNWCYINSYPKRPLNSIFIEKEKRDILISRIQKFMDSEKWYVENGIPYQIGILLYGPPGTGKTSLIKTIAGYFDKNVCVSSIYGLLSGESFYRGLPDNSIIVIEDIDTANSVLKRKKEKNDIEKEKEKNRKTPKYDDMKDGKLPAAEDKPELPKQQENNIEDILLESYLSFGLSGLLNALDGIVTMHGRILFMTTNHPEKLDNAIIRPGRIDLKLEIGYVNEEIFEQFIKKFYPNNLNEFRNYKLKINNLTCAKLQEHVLNNDNFEKIKKLYLKGI